MNEFIEKNRRLLRFYSVAAQWTAVVMLISATIYITAATRRFSDIRGWVDLINLLLHLFLDYIVPGSLALLVAQFIKYLIEMDYRPGWILRHQVAILYLCAVLVAMNSIWQWFFYIIIVGHSALDVFSTTPSRLLCIFVSLLLTAAKVLILVGLAQILRRVMPVIEESKMLV